MPLWGSVDNAANSDIAVLNQVKRAISTSERTDLYNNVTADVYVANVTIGQFGMDAQEMSAAQGNAHPQHAGWVLRTVGTGGRAGRVMYETLVAMGSMSGDGEDAVFPDYSITIFTQPSSNTFARANAVSLAVVADSVPTGGTLIYQWQKSYAAVPAWTDVPNSGTFSGATTATLAIANNTIASGNTFRAFISVAGPNGVANVYTSNAVITAT